MNNVLSQMKRNPMQFLTQKGFNIPQNMNDPNAIIQYLMNTGQVSQTQYDQAMRTINQLKR
jgi:hypothetical protein